MNEIFTDFYDAWQYVSSHPANSIDRKKKEFHDNCFLNGCLDIDVVKINPESNEIEIAEGKSISIPKRRYGLNTVKYIRMKTQTGSGFVMIQSLIAAATHLKKQ